MNPTTLHPISGAAAHHQPTSLESCDEFTLPDSRSRCLTELLGAFALQMAEHGRPVSSDMMLADREYAVWQLARARALGDESLRLLAAMLFADFDERQGWGARLRL